MRVLDFSDGFTSASAPTASGIIDATGSFSSPLSITAVGGITAGSTSLAMMYLQGSGGAVDVTANPQISAGALVGQIIIIIGCSNTNTLKLDDGTGLTLNGNFTMGSNDALAVQWDGIKWSEIFRAEN